MGREERLLDDMKAAMKSGDKHTLEAIRLLRSELKNASIAKGKDLSDEDVIGVLSKEAKKRKESLEIFKKGGREDLAKKEARELELIYSYLPEALSSEALEEIINNAIQEVNAVSIKEMGKVMSIVMSQIKGRAEGGVVQEMVKKKLSS